MVTFFFVESKLEFPPQKKQQQQQQRWYKSCALIFAFYFLEPEFYVWFLPPKIVLYVFCLNWKYARLIFVPPKKKQLIPLRLALWEWGSPTGITLAKERGQALIWNNPQICSLKHFWISIVWARCVQKVQSNHDTYNYNRFASLGPRHLNFFSSNNSFPSKCRIKQGEPLQECPHSERVSMYSTARFHTSSGPSFLHWNALSTF